MANSRSKSRRGRGRSRKRRPAAGTAGAAVPDAEGEAGRREAGQREAGQRKAEQRKAPAEPARTHARAGESFRAPQSVGPRPQAPWHPWPLSEMLILVGAIGAVVGITRLGHGGISSGGPVLFAGLAAVALGTLEISWREHNAGYRSHTLLLTLLPVVVLHSAIALGLAAVTTVSRLLNVALLALDAIVFAVLFKLLRARFQDARARVVSRL